MSHLSNSSVLAALAETIRKSRAITAALLSLILEVEERQLYRDIGYGSMRAFLIEEHHFSEDAAERRLSAAHASLRHPELLERVADGRLHLTAISLLAAHLDDPNAGDLIEASTYKTRSQIQALLLARKASRVAIAQPEITLSSQRPAPARVLDDGGASEEHVIACEPAQAQVEGAAPERISKVALRESTRELLRYAHDLLAGAIPFGDHDRVIAQSLKELVARLERRKFARTSKPRTNSKPSENARTSGKPSPNPRTIPAEVRRAVATRDGGRCSFVGPTGHRCESRAVEFDHIVPIAKGGTSTISNVRQLCRPHNQLEAERAFGRAFMDGKRTKSDDPDHRDLVSGLHGLGYRAAEAKEAADHAMRDVGLSLEQRMRTALAWLRPRRGVVTSPAPRVFTAPAGEFGSSAFAAPPAP